jgi:hypothetical protein
VIDSSLLAGLGALERAQQVFLEHNRHEEITIAVLIEQDLTWFRS